MAVIQESHLRRLLEYFPKESTSYVFGYGSGVFQQHNREPGKMIDLIFVVDDSTEWHRQNLEMNWEHYSNLRFLGPYSISTLQNKLGCGVYYNTYAQIEDMVVKYGVISQNAFKSDLLDWKFIYVAGRLHKPVLTLKQPSDENNNSLSSVLSKNRMSALRIALLQLPEIVTTEQLYLTITELSYLGDYRMSVAENPNKVKNIVLPLIEEYNKIYLKLLDDLGELVQVKPGGILYQKTDPTSRLIHLMALPSTVQQNLVAVLNKLESPGGVRCAELTSPHTTFELEEIQLAMMNLSKNSNIATIIRESIKSIVMIASLRQTLTGFISTGLFNSIYYAYDKFMKSNFVHSNNLENQKSL